LAQGQQGTIACYKNARSKTHVLLDCRK